MTPQEKAALFARCGRLHRKLSELKHDMAATSGCDVDALMQQLSKFNTLKCILKKERNKVNEAYGAGTFERIMRECVTDM